MAARNLNHAAPWSGHRCSPLPSAHPPAEVPADEACIICLERPKMVILAPCGHRCTCKRCTRAIMLSSREKRNCPLCKERIDSFVAKVFD